ncbi:single-stranded DNA-binding protein [Gemmatimonas phototrophica]|uniref:single-stranded DNA-binding protein n=1 Tax=Gemmatimonas phototrophica TaxID=1379270 RepID=UPI0006A6FF7F|nr:single-stranded DNA-binding protein [Gemmatimonas phototrophica]
MSRSLNKAILIGNVGSDPEIRTVGTGGRVATFSLATGRQWTDQTGNKQEKTEWHRCVVWNSARGSGLADVVEKYVKKGEKIYVEGEIEYRQWQDKEGQTRYTTEIKVKELMLLGGGGGRSGGMGDDMDSAPRRAPAPSAPRKAAAPAAGGDDFNDFPGALADEDDDLPF